MGQDELIRKKRKYVNLKNSLLDVKSKLLNSGIDSELSSASRSMSSNYLINNGSRYAQSVSKISDDISYNASKIDNIVYRINLEIKDIDKQLGEL